MLLACTTAGTSHCLAEGAAQRLVSVRDTIEMLTLADPSYNRGGPSRGRVASFSPDGEQFIVVLRRGDVTSSTNRFSMLLWRSADALRGRSSPRNLLELSSSSNREAIAGVVWSADNETVSFLGEGPGEERQVFALNTRTGALQPLTNHPTSIRSFSRDASGTRIAFVAAARDESLWDEQTRVHGVVVANQFVADLLTGRKGYRYRGREDEAELFLQDTSGARPVRLDRWLARGSVPSLSPDGKYLVVTTSVPLVEVPRIWSEYGGFIPQYLELLKAPRGMGPPVESYLERYEVVETRTGSSRVVLNAPTRSARPAVWIGGRVILSDTFLPLDVADPVERAVRATSPFTVEVDVGSGEIRRKIEAPTPRSKGLDVFLEEGMSTPPKIYVRPPGGRKAVMLWDLNPQFRDLRFGKVEEVSWEWSKGERISAGLYYPPDYQPGKPYPMVIQTHGWDPKLFWIDGPWPTAYAAQPLAARGIVVLQVLDEYRPEEYGIDGQLKEVEKALIIYRSAIAFLQQRGLIDAHRVGVIGFSHTCFYVKYALAHAPSLFAAASVSEGEDGGYLRYLTRSNTYVDADSLYGGPPFGDHLKGWMERAPGFNLHRVQTPLRITTLNPRFLLGDWEWFEGLTLLEKPVDLVMLEDGQHILQKPAERMVSQEGNVDWFDFWLNGHEDPDLGKAAQYARWRKLREASLD